MTAVDTSAAPMLRGPVDPDLFRTQHYGARWYIDPLPADDRWAKTDDSWPSVTTVKKAWGKPFRKKLPTGDLVPLDAYWAAEYTVDHLDAIAKLDREGAMALIATCGRRTLNKAARRGSGVHTILEDLAVGRRPDPLLVGDDVRPFLPACEAFVAECAPTWRMTEVVAINRTIGYGGTTDAVVEVPGVGLCLVDWKTRGGDHGAYEEEAAQLGGYSLAEYVVIINPETGAPERVDLPPVDAGLVVSLTADGYRLFPIDIAEAQNAFRMMYDTWSRHRTGTKLARSSIGKPLVLRPAGPAAEPASAPVVDPAQVEPADAERLAWVRDRVATIVGAVTDGVLPRPWPADAPTFKAAAAAERVHTVTELAAVITWCDDVERELQLPFPLPDPADKPAPTEPEPEPAPPAPPAPPGTEWADKGRALASLVDDADLFRACADVARCADVVMTRPRYLCLQAVVTQVADPVGAVEAAYGATGCRVVPADEAAARMAETAGGKSHALARAKRLIKRLDLGIPSPRSLAVAAADPLLAALVAAGHGVADPGAATPNTTNPESEK